MLSLLTIIYDLYYFLFIYLFIQKYLYTVSFQLSTINKMFQQIQRADFSRAVCLTIYNNLKIYKRYNKIM